MSKLIRSRLLAFERQKGQCFYCHVRLWLADPSELISEFKLTSQQAKQLQVTAEHLRAREDGGKDESENIAAACCWCNRNRHKRKSPLSPELMQRHVERRIAKGRWHSPWIFEKGLISSAGSGLR